MPYIGRDTDKISNVEVLDNITFDGSSSYTLQKGGSNFTPSSANTLLLSIDGVVQAGNFTVSGSTIDFGTAVAGTSTCDFVLHYGVGLITSPSDGTVTTAKLGDSAVTTAKLNDASVSLTKLTATGTKDSTTFLRGDNTFAEPSGGGITEVDLWRINTTTSISAGMDITANWERCDTNFEKIGTGLTESSGVFTFPSTGKYLTCYDIQFKTTQNTNYAGIYLYLSTDGGSNFSHIVANTNTQIYAAGGLSLGSASGCGVIDVTDASNFKFKLQVDYQNTSSGTPGIYAHTDRNRSYIHIIRLGDT
jgi:hypothetical protein